MYFRNYRLSNTWLDHSLKSAVSEYPSTVNKLKGLKHLWNLNERTFITFFHHSEGEVFVNTITADYNYPFPDCENLSFPIQMQLP